MIADAWQEVDDAIALWPQFWGMRLQDSGVRLRLLPRPFAVGVDTWSRGELAYMVDSQIYRADLQTPYDLFMEITPQQAWECSIRYRTMTAALARAVDGLKRAAQTVPPESGAWALTQAATLETLHFFWKTYENIFRFFAARDLGYGAAEQQGDVDSELANLESGIAHLECHPETVLRAARKWGQCFGPDLTDDLRKKLHLMQKRG